jgi:hypothetical protein
VAIQYSVRDHRGASIPDRRAVSRDGPGDRDRRDPRSKFRQPADEEPTLQVSGG